MSEETIFSKIIRGEIPCDKVYETDEVLAFRDINPAAPVHVLVIPKRSIVHVGQAHQDDALLLGKLMLAAKEVARLEGLEESGFRLVINNGAEVGQTVFHLHVHVLGGRAFSWPPG
ncbi:histidine triad nucleotide-binding protein [Lujinxingia litoralis]|uniref:Histidine triad nucleotide-binding protein n=1 Tax=Lujinxingia litoralis TaxID=2211119 RepID=A0A328C7I6_9DELT|nr:histidine triad nucleotide-binding protein [Lujinxingia litoralis]RAL23833.1 histidine triad nucleotide-binding protein [Lujinxingia litoralis]